jgi:hypothetical protein
MWELGVSILPLSTILISDLGIVPTVWYFLFFTLYYNEQWSTWGRYFRLFVCLIVVNATFTNILVISWRSVLLVEETGVPGENHRTVASHWQINAFRIKNSATGAVNGTGDSTIPKHLV